MEFAQAKAQKHLNGELVIESVSANIPLDATESCLEFLLVSFCKHFKMHPKQSAGLLTQSGKYLSYIISRGLKGKHTTIILWYDDILRNSFYLVQLIIKEINQGSIDLILSALMPGLGSKNLETVLFCINLLQDIANKLKSFQNTIEKINKLLWEWFAYTGGLENCLKACGRFGAYIKSHIVDIILVFSRKNVLELLSVAIKDQIPNNIEYTATVNELLPLIHEKETTDDKAEMTEAFEYLIETCILDLQDTRIAYDEKIAKINLLCDIWILVPHILEAIEQNTDKILTILERISRDKSNILKVTCLGKYFQILRVFTASRNQFAPMVYKIITFTLVENYSEETIKEFILSNFINLFSDMPEIPVKILLEPLIKHLKISNNINLNIIDFTFFSAVCDHPKLNYKQALQVIDILAKIYLNNLEYSELTRDLFLKLSERFIDIESLQQYLGYLIKFYLSFLEDYQDDVSDSFRNQAVMELILGCVRLHSDTLNRSIQFHVCDMIIKNYSPRLNQWLMNLLNIIGDPLEIMEDYKKHLKIDDAENKKYLKEHKSTPDLTNQTQEIKAEKIPPISAKKSLRKQVETKTIAETPPDAYHDSEKRISTKKLSAEENYQIKILLKQNKGFLLEIFKKYCISKKSSKTETFEELNDSLNIISDYEFYEILKDTSTGLETVSQTMFNELVKNYCLVRKKSKKTFNFIEFQELLIECGMMIYSSQVYDYFLYPPLYTLIHTINNLKSLDKVILKKNAVNSNSLYKKSILNELDQKLKKNFMVELPYGYKKIESKEIEINYLVPLELNLSDSMTVCLSLFDSILFDCLGCHFLEPIINVVFVYRAKPDFKAPHIRSKDIVTDKDVSNYIKLEASKLLGKYEIDVLKEVSYVLDGILLTLDRNLPKNSFNNFPDHKNIDDKNKLKKKVLRVQLTQTKLKRPLKSDKIKEDKEKQKILIKKLEEKLERDRKIRQAEIEKWKKTRDEELKQKELKEKARLIKLQQIRQKRREEFFETEKLRLEKLSQDNIEKKINLTKLEQENQNKMKIKRMKTINTHKIELQKARKVLEEEKIKEKNMKEEFESPEVQEIFKTYEKSLELVYLHFSQSREMSLAEEFAESKLMNFESFYKFSTQFKITPKKISQTELKNFLYLQ